MVFHTMGGDVINTSMATNLLNSVDFVFVRVSDEPGEKERLEKLKDITPGTVFTWKTASERKVHKATKMISGTIAQVAEIVSTKILGNRGCGLLRKRRDALGRMGEKKDHLSKLMNNIREAVVERQATHATTSGRQLRLTDLVMEKSSLLHEQLFGDKKAGDMLTRNNGEQRKVALEQCPALVQMLLEILKGRTRTERLMGCLEMAKSLAETDRIRLEHEMARVEELEAQLGICQDDCKDLDAAKSDLNKKRTDLLHVWRELGYLYRVVQLK